MQSSSTRTVREPLIGGLVLVGLGVVLLLAQYAPAVGVYVPLVVGLALLAVFAVRRSYGALVAGAIVTGVGIGVAIAANASGEIAGAAVLLSLGGGFVGIWLLSQLFGLAERHWWPLVPGSILLFIGSALAIGGGAMSLITYWPVVLIAVGVLIVLRALLPADRRDEVSPLGTGGAAR